MQDRHCIYAKIYGERNTGTNFVQELIQKNFAACCLQGSNHIYAYIRGAGQAIPDGHNGEFRSSLLDMDSQRTIQSDFGWKHGVPPAETIIAAPHARHTLFIAVTKHPLSWLHSLMERPYNPVEKPPRDFSQFIRHEWKLTGRDNIPGRDRINIVDLWNVKSAAYHGLGAVVGSSIVVAYEKILSDPSGFLTDVGSYLIAKRRKLVWSLASTKDDEMSFEQYRDKYTMEGPSLPLTASDVDYVKARIDPSLMEAFGYGWRVQQDGISGRNGAEDGEKARC